MGWHWRSKPWLSCTGAPAPAVVNPEDIELGDGVDEEEDAGGDDGDVRASAEGCAGAPSALHASIRGVDVRLQMPG